MVVESQEVKAYSSPDEVYFTLKQSDTQKVNDVKYDLNNEVPRLWIKLEEVAVVSMTKHYVTTGLDMTGTNTTTFVYVTKDNPEQKVLSINNLGEVFDQ